MSSLAAERRSEGCARAPATAGSDDAAVRLLGASKRFGKIVALEDATLSDPPRRAHDPARAVRLRQDHVAQSGRRISWADSGEI